MVSKAQSYRDVLSFYAYSAMQAALRPFVALLSLKMYCISLG